MRPKWFSTIREVIHLLDVGSTVKFRCEWNHKGPCPGLGIVSRERISEGKEFISACKNEVLYVWRVK